jgi:hypothetical protein
MVSIITSTIIFTLLQRVLCWITTTYLITFNAKLYGGEIGLHFHPHPLDWLHYETSFETVTGKKQDGDYLPLIQQTIGTIPSDGVFNQELVGSGFCNAKFKFYFLIKIMSVETAHENAQSIPTTFLSR